MNKKMHHTGYLSVLSSDLYNYCKRFVYKRLLPSNLLAPRTVLFECQHKIENVRSFDDEIYVLYSNVVHKLTTKVCKTYAKNVLDVAIAHGDVDIVLDENRNLDFGFIPVVFGNYYDIIATKNGYLYVKNDSVISAYNIPRHRMNHAIYFEYPIWSVKNESVKIIVDYDEHRLLFVCCGAYLQFVNKSDGVTEHTLNVHWLVHNVVVDDERKMLLLHQDGMFSIWDSSLCCITTGDVPFFCWCICLHNQTLLFTVDRRVVMAIE